MTKGTLYSSRRSGALRRWLVRAHKYSSWKLLILVAWRSSLALRPPSADADVENDSKADDYAFQDVLAVPDLLAYGWQREQ